MELMILLRSYQDLLYLPPKIPFSSVNWILVEHKCSEEIWLDYSKKKWWLGLSGDTSKSEPRLSLGHTSSFLCLLTSLLDLMQTWLQGLWVLSVTMIHLTFGLVLLHFVQCVWVIVSWQFHPAVLNDCFSFYIQELLLEGLVGPFGMLGIGFGLASSRQTSYLLYCLSSC